MRYRTVSHINDGHINFWNSGKFSSHKFCDYCLWGEWSLYQNRPDDKSWINRHNLKSFRRRKWLLIVPNSLLCQKFRFIISRRLLCWFQPIIFIENFLSWGLIRIKDRNDWWRDDKSFNFMFVTCFNNCSCTINSGINDIWLSFRCLWREGRGSMYYKLSSRNSFIKR